MTRFPFYLVRSIAPALLALMVSAAALVGLTAPAAATPESDCFNFVQGNIPWNQSGASTWNPANIQSLCQGTAKAAEPGRCFDRVMSGGINWGGGTVWEWKNAIALCKGTNDANATVGCFQGKIGGGQTWQQAIAQCGPSTGNQTAEAGCFDFVQGNIPWNLSGASTWNPTNIKALCQGTSKPAEPGRCFDRVVSGGVSWGGGTVWQWENALALCKGTDNANATVGCFQGKIAGGQNWQQAIAQCKS
jgi:5-methylcytosine-specific restriction endonuclease McrA